MADISKIKTCDDAIIALAGLIQPMTDFDVAIEAAFEFAKQIARIKCTEGGDHRVVKTLLTTIDFMLASEGDVSLSVFAAVIRDIAEKHQQNREQRRERLQEAEQALDQFMQTITSSRRKSRKDGFLH